MTNGNEMKRQKSHYAVGRNLEMESVHVSEAEPVSSNIISAMFWSDLQANGRAATRIQR